MIEMVPRGTRVVAMRFSEPMHQALERGWKTQTRRQLSAGNCALERGEFQRLDLSGGRVESGAWPVAGVRCRRETPAGQRSTVVLPRIVPNVVIWSRRGQSGPAARRENATFYLRVTEVRASRLIDISEQDAYAEGVLIFCPPEQQAADYSTRCCAAYCFQLENLGKTNAARWRAGSIDREVQSRGRATARDAFALLFESINGPGSWARNPWVWRYTFQKVTPPGVS